MNLGRIKNGLISVLCILAIYQTIGLWFESISGRNFFYTFFAMQNKTNTLIEYDFTNPRNIVISFGNENFNKFFIDKDGRRLNEKIDDCIEYMAQNGEYIQTKYIEWDEILKYKSVICYYGINVSMSSYMKSMGSKAYQNFSSKQKSFDALALVPARTTGEHLKAYFINTSDGSCSVFSYKKNKVNDNLYAAIEEIQKQSNNISYISTYQSGFPMFETNVFLPQISTKDILYRPIKISIPNTIQQIENKYVDNFFENPILKWNSQDSDGVFMFSDENIVIRYYPSGLFEYSNYRLGNYNSNNDFESALNAAIELIKIDKNLLYDNIYMSKSNNSGNKWTFGFDYYFDDFPIILSDELKQQLGIQSIIEIVVENGIATSYKRYLFEIEPLDNIKSVNQDFSSVLDKVMAKNTDKQKINNMYLSYILDSYNDYSNLMWVVETRAGTYTEITEIR